MVRGLGIFKKYFEEFSGNYVIIGGTACDLIIEEAGFTPRVTKDIDIILIVEALTRDFVNLFWQFIRDGNYQHKEKSEDERKYYRFIKPENYEFPYQIELFARNPDLLDLDEETYLTPVPVEEALSSLSAILLDDDYYKYLIGNSIIENGLHHAKTEALICLKAKAYLDIANRIAKGGLEDSKQFRKHKGDIFRLAAMLKGEDVFELPETILSDMQEFANAISGDLPEKAIFKEMGLVNLSPQIVFSQILRSFQIAL
jgi:hypothetical protein